MVEPGRRGVDASAAAERHGPFPVYIPAADLAELRDILPRSAIVGFPLEADPSRIHIFYEGNQHGAEGLRRYADRAQFAAARCRWFQVDVDAWELANPGRPVPPVEYGYASYPTRAQAFVPADAVRLVAIYDDYLGVLTPTSEADEAALRRWIGSDDPAEWLATGVLFEVRRRQP